MKKKIAFLIFILGGLQAHAERSQRPDHAKFEAELQNACGADISSLCPSATDPRERGKCLHDNEASLSENCLALVSKMKSHHPPRGERPPGP